MVGLKALSPSGVRLFLAVRVDSGTRVGINSEQRHQKLDETHIWSPSIHPTRRRGGPHDRPHSSEYPFVSPPCTGGLQLCDSPMLANVVQRGQQKSHLYIALSLYLYSYRKGRVSDKNLHDLPNSAMLAQGRSGPRTPKVQEMPRSAARGLIDRLAAWIETCAVDTPSPPHPICWLI